jgi:hypothetical protein
MDRGRDNEVRNAAAIRLVARLKWRSVTFKTAPRSALLLERASLARRAPAPLFWAAFAANFLLIVGRLVDFPYKDEWDYIVPEGLAVGPQLSFLFRQHSDHFMVTTHLQTWALFRLVDWDLVTGATFNYLFIFAMIPLLLARIGRLQLGGSNWILWLFLLSILTPFNPYHQFGLLMVGIVHYIVLFLLSVVLLFEAKQKTWQVVAGALSAVAATHAVSAGVISSLVTLALFAAHKYLRVRAGAVARRELAQVIIAGALILPAAMLWFLRYHNYGAQSAITYPTDPAFWRFLFALNALGVGRPGEVWVGAALVVIAGLPIVLTWNELRNGSNPAWVRLTITACVLTSELAIAAARTGMGFGRVVEAWHYHGVVELLVPMAVLGWCAGTRGRPLAAILLVLGASLCLLTWRTFTTQYLDLREEAVLAGRRCVVEKLSRGAPVDCPATFHSPVDAKLLVAKQKNLSFYRRLEADVEDMRASRAWVVGSIYTPGSEIDFRSTGNALGYQKAGWSKGEPWATWTVGEEAVLAMPLAVGGGTDLELRAVVTPFVVPQRPTLTVEVVANGTPVAHWAFSVKDATPTIQTALIPSSVAGKSSLLELRFRIADPRSPAEFGQVDTRKLGIAFRTLTLTARSGT